MVLFVYSICASHMWIFMEGLYLYMLIYSTLSTERRGVKMYVISGWGRCHYQLDCECLRKRVCVFVNTVEIG